MTVPEIYDYLVRARRDLWATLEGVPDEVLSRQVLDGKRLHSIKDLVFHTAVVEDCCLHEDIRREKPVLDTFPSSGIARGPLCMRVLRSERCSTTGGPWSRAPSRTWAR
jgi:hypothetical protein